MKKILFILLTAFVTFNVNAQNSITKGEKSITGANRSTTTTRQSTNSSSQHNGHQAVDMGLSVKWATCNVGASSPEGYGNYYAWAETTTKRNYDWGTYKWCRGTQETIMKYCSDVPFGRNDGKTKLDLADDVARKNWGGSWRIATQEEWEELINKCDWEWTSMNGVYGYRVTSKINGNSIFLPASGKAYTDVINSKGEKGRYWTSTPDSSDGAYSLMFTNEEYETSDVYRKDGHTIRPVFR